MQFPHKILAWFKEWLERRRIHRIKQNPYYFFTRAEVRRTAPQTVQCGSVTLTYTGEPAPGPWYGEDEPWQDAQ